MAGRSNASKKPCNSSVETLTEVFRCFICMEKLQDAHLCPHCSKLCCYSCIRRWLTEQRSQCPHCRATLLLFELVNCRWVEEVTQNLESLRAAGSEGGGSGGTGNSTEPLSERCPDHPGEHLTVFCESCSKCICHRCALWGGTAHAGHSFKPIAEVYEQHSQKIKAEISELQQRQLKLANVMLKVEHSVEVVRQARDEKANEVYRAVESMISHLDGQLRSNILTLTGRKGLLGQESEKLDAVINDVEQKMSTCSHADLIRRSKEILDTIRATQRRPLTHLVAAPVLGEFKSEMVPPYDSGTFLIQHFGRLQAKGDAMYSPPLHVHGLCWRLKVYPNGNGIVRGLYLSVFLELTAGLPGPSKYEYRIEMIHQASQDHQRSIVREFASDFEVGECWGYNRFFRLDLLTREGYMDSSTGTLELKFHVRALTYFQKCRDQEWYISQLQGLEAQYSAQINELQEKRGKDDTVAVGTSEASDTVPDLSGLVVHRRLRFNLPQRRENQIGGEEPIRESNANSDSEIGHLSIKSNTDSFKSGTSQVTEIFDSLDDESDVLSHDPSEDGSSDDILYLSSSPIRLIFQESPASPQNNNNRANRAKFSKSSSWFCSTPNSTTLQRFAFSCNRSHPSAFHSLSNVHVDAGGPSTQPTSDFGYDLSDILEASSNIADEALPRPTDTLVTSAEQSETVPTETGLGRRRTLSSIPSKETGGIHFKILDLHEELRLSGFSASQAVSDVLDGLGSSTNGLAEESSPRAPPVPHQPSHELRHIPLRNSCQNCATNQQSTFLTSLNEAGTQAETENSENGNADDEVFK